MSDLARTRNEELARILHQLGWNPERLAREVNLVLPSALSISSTAPYKWRDRGMVPRAPHDQAVCEVLSHAVGIAVTYQQLWGRMGRRRGAKALSPRLLTDPWTADTAQTALAEAAAEVAPVRLTDLFRGDELELAARHWASPPPPVTGGEGALRIAPEQLTDLRISHDSKWRLEQSCGGGLVLNPAKAELSMVGKLLELGSYAWDEQLGRELYGAASRLARLVGWADFDMGNEAAAQRAFVAALRAAHVSGDPRLGVSVVGCLAVQATDNPGARGLDTVAMLDTALRAAEGTLTARERALQLGRIARAYGRRGEPEGARRAAEEAFAALGAEPGRLQERADLDGMVGEAYLFLGDHERARALLASAVRELAPERARAKALLMVRLADSYRRTGDHERAAPIADRARRLAAGMQSARVARALRDFDTASRLSSGGAH
ncbi:tetratricopeptide (TPR) repeat protein [Kitasatospora sp. MAP12-15]|uniref:tetratricopeptide repeat protein n=1 Tax=unclassified Kitasatospora TaxID=2633591 RepID=UPI0024740423|nr:tetratricopeptide repeat protein [Kitasatospora sp. MAP12-44]MDH6110482.1 tetratricopeptide (TPR) repeat protein [Kitasatospora sp. MAP12-44]